MTVLQVKIDQKMRVLRKKTQDVLNFPNFSESKGILKIGPSEVYVWVGGSAEGRTLKSIDPVYL